ncbi:NAD kinase 2, mitochondrial-like [Corticium candelabrum]|uniref:NAD kinase 2, mitochondrial-like n=1 Tax=Corticium candelabrum TaxID=121492 RepID=UPI002E260072|nr:NAD kinase 2, mitochondrial-like [Corticium candelabrum]
MIRRGFATSESFSPCRILVLHKLTRYEFERRRHRATSPRDLRELLAARGSSFDGLYHRYNVHRKSLREITDFLSERRIKTRIMQIPNVSEEDVQWADALLSAGGDGNMLFSASKIRNSEKPLIGINTDPEWSQGQLCVRRRQDSSITNDLDMIFSGYFRWKFRQRIHVTLSGSNSTDLASHQSVLPLLSLNEVFMGECDPFRTSYFEVSIDGSVRHKQKSSGMVACTGSGSSAWAYNISRVTEDQVKSVVALAGLKDVSAQKAKEICDDYNRSLLYDASDLRMAYAIRDCIAKGIFAVEQQRGFANRMSIKSRCFDANLVIDGNWSWTFNNGSVADLKINDADALRTIELID